MALDWYLVGVWAVIVGMVVFIYLKFYNFKGEKFVIDYSEFVNDTIVSKGKPLMAQTSKDGRSIIIKGLKGRDGKTLKRPYPELRYQVPTNSPIKKVYIVKISQDRYCYRTVEKNNDVWMPKKDEMGKIIKENGNITLQQSEWNLADDIIEVDDKDWYEFTVKDLEEKHRQQSKWDTMKPLIVMAIIFIFAVIAMKFMSDNWKEMVTATSISTKENINQADKIIASINKLTGQKPTGENEVLLNATTS